MSHSASNIGWRLSVLDDGLPCRAVPVSHSRRQCLSSLYSMLARTSYCGCTAATWTRPAPSPHFIRSDVVNHGLPDPDWVDLEVGGKRDSKWIRSTAPSRRRQNQPRRAAVEALAPARFPVLGQRLGQASTPRCSRFISLPLMMSQSVDRHPECLLASLRSVVAGSMAVCLQLPGSVDPSGSLLPRCR